MATSTITPDIENDPKFETMSLEDLRKLAEEEAKKQSTNTTTVTDPKETPSTEEEEEEVEVKEFSAERSFDLGDGAGSQVFKGKGETREDALEDLSNKLIEAQKNATKRIKELKTTTTTKAPEPALTKEQEAVLAAEVISKPSETIIKILKAHGIDINDVKETTEFLKTQKVQAAKKATADSFVAAHPDYADTASNGKKINKWCELHNDFSLDGMNKAYQDLNESGLLQVKGEEAGQGQEENKSGTRIEEKTKVTPPPVTRKASGLSTHRRTPTPVVTEPSEDELYSMPLDKLRAIANKQIAGQ